MIKFFDSFLSARIDMYKEFYKMKREDVIKLALEMARHSEKFIKNPYKSGVYLFSSIEEAQKDLMIRLFGKKYKDAFKYL